MGAKQQRGRDMGPRNPISRPLISDQSARLFGSTARLIPLDYLRFQGFLVQHFELRVKQGNRAASEQSTGQSCCLTCTSAIPPAQIAAASPSAVPMDARARTQTDRDRRELRKSYKDVNNQLNRDKEKLCSGLGTEELQSYLRNVDSLQQSAVKPREFALDADVFRQLTEVGCTATKKLASADQGHCIYEFIKALQATYDSCEASQHKRAGFDWSAMGASVEHYFRTVPGVSSMLGPMDAEIKVRKVAERRAKRPLGEVVRPEELKDRQNEDQQNEKQETDRNMEEMYSVLSDTSICPNNESPVADLVCNHRSFAQTVENLFALSFLVRDGRARLYFDKANGLVAKKLFPSNAAGKKEESESSQFVISFNMDDWDNMKKIVPTNATKMHHRNQDHLENKFSNGGRQPQSAGPSEAGPSSAGIKSEAGPSSRKQRRP